MTTKLTLTHQAILTGTNEHPYYTARAKDESGNVYQLNWEITVENFDECDDESNACDWENPSSIYKDGHELDVKDFTIA